MLSYIPSDTLNGVLVYEDFLSQLCRHVASRTRSRDRSGEASFTTQLCWQTDSATTLSPLTQPRTRPISVHSGQWTIANRTKGKFDRTSEKQTNNAECPRLLQNERSPKGRSLPEKQTVNQHWDETLMIQSPQACFPPFAKSRQCTGTPYQRQMRNQKRSGILMSTEALKLTRFLKAASICSLLLTRSYEGMAGCCDMYSTTP